MADQLEQDLAHVHLAPAATIRRRGHVRSRRQTLGVALAGAVVVGGCVAAATAYPHEPPAALYPAGQPGAVTSSQPTPIPRSASPGASVDPRRELTAHLFYDDGSTMQEHQTVEGIIKQYRLVGQVHFVSHAEAWANFQTEFKDSPAVLAVVGRGTLPESEVFTLADINDFTRLRARVEHLPGVEDLVPALGSHVAPEESGGWYSTSPRANPS